MHSTLNVISKSAQVWILATGPLHDHVPIKLYWQRVIPPSRGTKYQRERLVQSLKGLMAAFIEQGGENGALAAGSINNFFGGLRRIVAWMTERNIWVFRDLQPIDVVDYITQLQVDRGKPLTELSVNAIQVLFRKIWLLRHKYLMPIRFDPFVVESAVKLSVQTRKNVPWRHLDEEQALPLVKDALDWIQMNGGVVGNIVRRMWAERRTYVGLTKVQSTARVRRLYLELLSEPGAQQISRQLGMEASKPDSIVARIISVTEGACVVALLFMVGMRASELVRLDADCVALLGEEGAIQRTVLKGFAAKRQGMPRTWAASEDVVRVVQFLKNLYAEIREHTGQVALLLNKPSGAPIPLPGRKTGRLGIAVLNHRLHAFVNSPHRGLSSDIHVHAHMGRKTFAKFVVMRDKSALESLAYHYGHTHSAMTDGAYVGTDISLAKLISEEDRADLAEALMDLLSSGVLGGKAGEKMMTMSKHLPFGRTSFRGKKSLSVTVDKLIKDGISLAPCDWGYCVYSKAMSACGGDDKGPNPLRRAPDVCATCSNFSVTERHRPYWNERLRRDEEFLRRQELPDQTRQVASSRAAHSREVLVSLLPTVGLRKKMDAT